MSERDQALAQIVALAERHGLTQEEVRRALGARAAGPAKSRQGALARLFAYVGGTLVLAGACVLVGTFWDEMNSIERIVVTLGSGLAALVLSHLASLTPGRESLVTPLFLLAVLTEPAGIVVALREMSTGGNELLGGLVVSGVMAVQCLLVFASQGRGAPLFFALLFGVAAMSSALGLLDVDEELHALVVGVSTFLVTVAIARTRHAPITPPWYFASATLILSAWFSLVHGSLGELSEVALAGVFVYLSTVLRSRTLLATGTLGLLVYVGYFSGRHFADSVGWPLLLILLGVLMMSLGTVAVRIHRRYIKA